MNEPSNSNLDKFNHWIRSNKFTAALLVIGTIVIALSTFTDAARNLLELFSKDKRPAINGEWTAKVKYDWPGANYTETFRFEGEGENLSGFATFLERERSLEEGKVDGTRIQFVTKTQEIMSGGSTSRETIHRYSGVFAGDSIKFVLQTQGGHSLHSPLEFVARRIGTQTPNAP